MPTPTSTSTQSSRLRPAFPRVLRVAQCNVEKRSPAHTALLELCWADQIDIVLIQEPWIGYSDKMQISTHPGFDAYVPVKFWNSRDTRPRVMTYIRKVLRLQIRQQRPSQSRDILWVKAGNFAIINVYRPPGEPTNHTTTALLGYQAPERALIAGDFNVRCPSWHQVPLAGIGGTILQSGLKVTIFRLSGRLGRPPTLMGTPLT